MSPDAAFLDFFAGQWQRLLETTEIPGLAGASWDRKAAYLLWQATDKGKALNAPSPPSAPVLSDLSHGVFD
jgi:hypothetical protein